MGGINGTPVLIDDTSLYEEDNLHKFIYRLAEGKERGRLGKNYEKANVAVWNTATFLTAERPILIDETVAKKLEGVVGRLIEINVSGNDLFDSAKQAEAIEK